MRNTASVEEIASFAKRGGNHGRVDIKLATKQERLTMAPQPLSKHALVERAGGELVLAILLHNLTSLLERPTTTTPPHMADDKIIMGRI